MTFWSGEKLDERLPDLITPFDASKIDCAAYRLTVGPEAYVSPPSGKDNADAHTKEQLAAGEGIAVPPGQFGFLVTDEVVRVPQDTLGFISIRAKVKSRGLVNVSGFHVDPGYKGRLVFAVFNAGPAPVHLARGDDSFLIWFADLDRVSEHVKRDEGHTGISSDLINPIAGKVQSLAGLDEKIKATKEDLEKRLHTFERTGAVLLMIGTILLGALATFTLTRAPAWLATANNPPKLAATSDPPSPAQPAVPPSAAPPTR